jgi:hypothetical protein
MKEPVVLWQVIRFFQFFENHGYMPKRGLWFCENHGYES